MEREQTGLSGLLLVLSGCTSCCLLVVKTKVNGMAATRVKGMASMRVTAKRAKGENYMYVRSIEVVAGQRTTRHHWPIFVFTGYFHVWIFSLPRTNTRGNAACEYVDPCMVIFLYTLKHEKHHACEYVDPRVVIFLHTLNHRKYHACEYSDSRVTTFLFTLNNTWYHA